MVLQYANLGVAIAGIGVSAIGFTIMNKRLKSIEGQISGLAEKLDQQFQVLYERDLRKHYSQIYVLLEKADVAHLLANSSDEWRNVSSQLADEGGFLSGEIADLLSKDSFDAELFSSLIQSLALCNSARIECLLLAEEMPAAYKVADNIGRNYRALFDNISPFRLAKKIMQSTFPKHDNHHMFHKKQIEINALVHGVRDITDAALTKPSLIESLIDKGISGHDFIETIRNEKDHPILLLRHN